MSLFQKVAFGLCALCACEPAEDPQGLPDCAEVSAFSANPGSDGGWRWVAIASSCEGLEEPLVEWRLDDGAVVEGVAADGGEGCFVAEEWSEDLGPFEGPWGLYVEGVLVVHSSDLPAEGGYESSLVYQAEGETWSENLPGFPGC